MTQTVLVIIGAIAVVPLVFAFGVLFSIWRAWWLHPLWSLVVVPLGVPAITFWPFVALLSFWHTCFVSHPSLAESKETSDEKITRHLTYMAAHAITPIGTYYLIRWYLQ